MSVSVSVSPPTIMSISSSDFVPFVLFLVDFALFVAVDAVAPDDVALELDYLDAHLFLLQDPS